jgi:NAD+ kinase
MSETQKPILSVAIYTHRKVNKEAIEKKFLRKLINFFESKGVKHIHGDMRTLQLLDNEIPLMDEANPYHLKVGIGGDGILLRMIRNWHKKDRAMVGINFGTLGFLSELTPKNALEGLESIFSGEYTIDQRMILKAYVWRKNSEGRKEKIFRPYGLNEMVFGHGGLARLTNFNVKVDRRNLSKYRCDGLIFATPTGSTAYSMSAGGPIIYPRVDSILVTPVAAHSLSHRPILLPDSSRIHLDFDSRAHSISLTVDGQEHYNLEPGDEVTILRATRTAKFIRLKQSHYFKTLRNKMGWGE